MSRDKKVKPLEVGDWVKLRAGSQPMQILDLEDGGAKCLWHLGVQQQVAWVSSIVLVKVDSAVRYNPVQKPVQRFQSSI